MATYSVKIDTDCDYTYGMDFTSDEIGLTLTAWDNPTDDGRRIVKFRITLTGYDLVDFLEFCKNHVAKNA